MSSPGGTGIASRNEGKGKCHLSFQVNDEERCFLEPERNDESGDSGRSRERRDDGGGRSGSRGEERTALFTSERGDPESGKKHREGSSEMPPMKRPWRRTRRFSRRGVQENMISSLKRPILFSLERVIRMNIRRMSIDDYDDVYGLWSGTTGMGLRSVDDSAEGIARFLTRNPDTSFVAEIEDRIAGVVLSGHDGRRGFIYHTAVRPEHRKKGIGKALVAAALAALKKERITKVALVVFSTNESGNAFWNDVGFEMRNDLIYRNISLDEKNT